MVLWSVHFRMTNKLDGLSVSSDLCRFLKKGQTVKMNRTNCLFIQAIDRVGTEEEITYKGWTDSIG